MKMHKFAFIVLLYSFTFLFITHSYSYQEINLSSSSMTKNAAEIVVAKCVKSEAKIDEKTGFIYTYTTFEVDQTVKNTMDTDKFELRIVGGQVGNIGTSVHGAPRFDEQEEMVLFLGEKNKHGYHTLMSFLKGMYKVEIDKSTGEKMIKNPPVDMSFPNANSKQSLSKGSISLDDFISSLKENF